MTVKRTQKGGKNQPEIMHQALRYIHLTALKLYLEITIIIPTLKMRKLSFSW